MSDTTISVFETCCCALQLTEADQGCIICDVGNTLHSAGWENGVKCYIFFKYSVSFKQFVRLVSLCPVGFMGHLWITWFGFLYKQPPTVHPKSTD